ncbi:hypothetical protein ACGFY7_23335 [Streptomyces prunicolor]|uniref:hypothetical protein n=1 Tax=Streptomyces prunicolor TaxID=67348 RepID=UPI0037211209
MTSQELAAIRAVLGPANPATPDAVRGLLTTIRSDDRPAESTAIRVRLVVPTVVKRLLLAETEQAALRSTVARLVVANNRGDDYTLSDLAFELAQAGLDLTTDYDHADALAHATEQEAL